MRTQHMKHFYQANKINVIALCIFFILILTGCWDYTEYEDMLLINAIGIDIEPNENDITLTIAYPRTSPSVEKSKPGGSSEGEIKDIVFTAYGKTIPEAVDHMQQMMSREIFLGYTSIVIVGKKAAIAHIEKILNYIDTSPTMRMSSRIIVTPGKASDLLSIVNTYEEKSVSNSLNEIFNTTEDTGATFPIMLKDFYSALSIEGYEPVASTVSVKKLITQKNEVQNETHQGMIKRFEGEVEIDGLALFNGFKLVGWLNAKESRGWGLIMNKKVQDFTSIHVSEKEYLTYRILKNTSKTKVHIDDDLSIDVNINVKCSIDELNLTDDFNDPAVVQKIEESIAAAIKENVEATVRKVQKEIRADVFGMGFQTFRQYPREWNQFYKTHWKDIFPNIPIHIHVEAKVLHTGYINEPLQEQ
ncbi:Ger(x)C family spore germination protein [Clostridiaceae bacterium 35-E11]